MLRYSLLTAGLMLGASAFAAPAGSPLNALACEGRTPDDPGRTGA